MTSYRIPLERRILSVLDESPHGIPVVVGGCHSGRTALLLRLQKGFGEANAQYIDLERTATTPERLCAGLIRATPFRWNQDTFVATNPKSAFDALLGFLDQARTRDGGPATFLFDEALELRMFESFPGLRGVVREFLTGIGQSGNRFVLTSRYGRRTGRALHDLSPRFVVLQASVGWPVDTAEDWPRSVPGSDAPDYVARVILALANGRAGYARILAETLQTMGSRAAGDPVSALAAALSRDGRLSARCCYSYELRLHRARGYGALKAILDILAAEEPLSLTEIAQRLGRTPGSTKDYLSWLEDVDLVSVNQKRYTFADPLLRLWVRLHCRASTPSDEEVAREVQQYALPRLPQREPVVAMAAAESAPHRASDDRKPWGIIEID